MTIARDSPRFLGTMIAYGFAGCDVAADLDIAARLGASVLEILPDWRVLPDPEPLRVRVADAGLAIHSAHGCWGGQSILAPRVDLGDLNPRTHSASVDDLKRCIDWLSAAGGTCLVVHPGGLSDRVQADPRRDALTRGLIALADHARGTRVVLCVENMPPGVHPGSQMDEIASVVGGIARDEVALALDTGHANISASVPGETIQAGRLLRTTHVHDNDGRQDSHLPPGLGTIAWDDWKKALNSIGYNGPIMLECIRHLRRHPQSMTPELLDLLKGLITL